MAPFDDLIGAMPVEILLHLAFFLRAEDAGRLAGTCRRMFGLIEDLVASAAPCVPLAISGRRRDDESLWVPYRLRLPLLRGIRKEWTNAIIFTSACAIGHLPMAKLRRPPKDKIYAVCSGLSSMRVDQSCIGLYRWLVTEYNLVWEHVWVTPMFYMGVGGYEWSRNNVSFITDRRRMTSPMCLLCPIEDARMDIVRRMLEDFPIQFRDNPFFKTMLMTAAIKSGDVKVYDDMLSITGYTFAEHEQVLLTGHAMDAKAIGVLDRLIPDVEGPLVAHYVGNAVRDQHDWFLDWLVDQADNKLRMVDRIAVPRCWRNVWLRDWAENKIQAISQHNVQSPP